MNHVATKYKIILDGHVWRELKLDICNDPSTSRSEHHDEKEEVEEEHVVPDRYFVLMKWFYFVTTCTTTIG